MPVKPFVQSRSSNYVQLVGELYSEWAHPDPNATEPIILEEHGERKKLKNLYVIWSKWADLDHVERGEIIMDAAQRKLPPGDVIEISIAMGLTPQEAVHMGIKT
jgi:hypothetical protein